MIINNVLIAMSFELVFVALSVFEHKEKVAMQLFNL